MKLKCEDCGFIYNESDLIKQSSMNKEHEDRLVCPNCSTVDYFKRVTDCINEDCDNISEEVDELCNECKKSLQLEAKEFKGKFNEIELEYIREVL